MAKIFLDVGETDFNIGNNDVEVFGQAGSESVNILEGVTGVVLDGNVEAVTLGGNLADYEFQQQGNHVRVYSGTELLATIPVQTDDDGTQLTFGDGSYDVEFGEGAVMNIGGTDVPNEEPGPVVPPTEAATLEIGADTAAAGALDASDADYTFVVSDGASYTQEITGFAAGDVLDFPADNDPTVINESFTDGMVDVQYAFGGNVSIVELTGLEPAVDVQLLGIQSFDDVFGEGTIIQT
jgi:hypothetical protein